MSCIVVAQLTPGGLMTLSDAGIKRISVVGPPDVGHHLATLRASVVRLVGVLRTELTAVILKRWISRRSREPARPRPKSSTPPLVSLSTPSLFDQKHPRGKAWRTLRAHQSCRQQTSTDGRRQSSTTCSVELGQTSR